MKRHYLLYVLAWCFALSLPTTAIANKYEADVTKKWPRVQYGPRATLYREQCEAWVLRLMFERNKGVRNRVEWEASWDIYAGNMVWCQQFPPYNEMYPPQQSQQYDVAEVTR